MVGDAGVVGVQGKLVQGWMEYIAYVNLVYVGLACVDLVYVDLVCNTMYIGLCMMAYFDVYFGILIFARKSLKIPNFHTSSPTHSIDKLPIL